MTAGATAPATAHLTVASRFSQPIYLIPGPLPDGLSIALPSPIVGSQSITMSIRARARANAQNYPVTIYAAGGGENHSLDFSLTVLPEGTAAATTPAQEPHWVGSWGASAVTPSNESGAYYLTNVTVRQIAHLSLGSPTGLRIRLSNALGRDAVSFASVHAALWAGDSAHSSSAILPATDHIVTFHGSPQVTIPGGAEVFSDAIALPVPGGADLAVSLYIPHSSNVPATMHIFGNQTAYFALGDLTASESLANTTTDTVRAYLTGVEVDAPGAETVVALGDSLTDGVLSSRNQNARWPDQLARSLQNANPGHTGVVNAGIAGSCAVVSCLGPGLLDRFQRDVLSVAGVKSLILLAGENDIGNASNLALVQLTDIFQHLVALAHERSILVYGGTIPPFGGSHYFSASHEKLRQQLNGFIRTGGLFDGVIDFDRTLADPSNAAYLAPLFDGDKMHPNDAGYREMGTAAASVLVAR